MRRLLHATRNQRSLSHANIVFDGNSISAWEDGTAAGKWTDRLKLLNPYSAPTCTFTNVAIPGRSTRTLGGEAVTKVDSLYVPGRLNISVIWEAINDAGGMSGNGLFMGYNLRDYCLARRNKGWKTVVFGLQGARVGTGVLTQAQYDVARTELNTYVATNWRTFADAYVDPNNSTKLNNCLAADVADGVHPSSIALNEILPLVDTALRSIQLSP
jgi:hypothetical protein